MISILPSTAALAVNVSQPFSGAGGTGPYTYSLISGAGNIDPVTGIYTSPITLPLVTDPPIIVRVTDSLSATATAQIAVLSPMELLCDILLSELGLASGRVWIWDQKVDEPTDSDPFVVLQLLTAKHFGNVNRFNTDTQQQNQSTNISATVSIDIKSRSVAAIDLVPNAIIALNSNYSEAQQELNGFRIFPLPSNPVVNLSELDGAAIPYRFNISVSLQYAVVKFSNVPYYDTFTAPSLVTEQ